jgi:hypothetical protein
MTGCTGPLDGALSEWHAATGCRPAGADVYDALRRPLIVLVGHAGSGKTEIALNLAFGFRECDLDVTVVDLDLVKPFFRCRMAREELGARGIRLVAPDGDRFHADLPILVPEARTAAHAGAASGCRVIFDVGGDRLGARVLGSLAGLMDPSRTDLLFVINARRPFAEDVHALGGVLTGVEAAARMRVNGLVANTHLLEHTEPETVREGIRAARALEAATGIPLRFCAVAETVTPAFGEAGARAEGVAILPLTRHILPPFQLRAHGARLRSTVA